MPSLKSVLTMLRKSPGAVSAKAPKGRIARAWDTMKGDNVRRVARNQQEMATRMANRSTAGKTPEQMLDRMNSYHSRMNKYDAALKRERAATIGTNAAVLGAGMYGLSKGLEDGRQAQMQQYGFIMNLNLPLQSSKSRQNKSMTHLTSPRLPWLQL